MLENARMLTRYNAWSNRLMYDAVAALPAGEAVKERKSLFKNMVHTLNHNYVIDAIWRAHLEGREHGYAARNTADYPPLAELKEKQQAMDQWFVAWGDAQTAASLDEKMSFTLIGGNAGNDDALRNFAARGHSHQLSPRFRVRDVLRSAGAPADHGSAGISARSAAGIIVAVRRQS